MSNELAIAAVTMTLRGLLEGIEDLADPAISGTLPADAAITAEILVNNLPLNEAHDFNPIKNHINLFLYHIEHNAAWRNMEIPGSNRNGESSHPPLSLNLYYIITAYGQQKNELIGHMLLGKAMSILHDHPVLSREEIESTFPGSRLHEQIERIRITSQPVSLDDVSKLWTGFQTQFRLSVAYQVSVVLIESKRPSRTPLPVLTRGIFVQPFVVPPFPTLQSVQYPRMQAGIQPGDELVLKGHHLSGDNVTILFRHIITGTEISRPASTTVSAQEIKFTVPNTEPTIWPPGLYSVKVVIHKGGAPDKTSNDIGISLIPIISAHNIQMLSPPEPRGYLATITFLPDIQPGQSAFILFGDKQFTARRHSAATNVLDFEMRNVSPGDYYLRLRIDGADSLLIIDTVTPPVFDPSLKVTIT